MGVDISKLTLDIALYDGELDWKGGHVRVSNEEEGYGKFKEWLASHGIGMPDVRLCMEHTGLYGHDFRKWLESEGVTYFMVAPRKMHRYEIPENVNGLGHVKSDRMDAYKIAIYCYHTSGSLRPSRMPPEALFQLKRLLAERRQYVTQRQLYKQLEKDIGVYDSKASQDRRESVRGKLDDAVKHLESEMDELIRSDAGLKRNYELLTSVIGVGRIVATTAIVLTENFTSIDNPRTYASYLAVAPYRKESGTSIRCAPRTGKAGFKQAKADLSVCALCALRCDPGIRSYWNRKKKEGKASGVVLNAIKFKLIERMFAVVRRNKPYIRMESFGK